MSKAEKCVCCGATIPEGRQVCIICGYKVGKPDLVEVVRCKDCKHWIYWADQKRCSCIKHHIQSNSYDFCSYGERKKEV